MADFPPPALRPFVDLTLLLITAAQQTARERARKAKSPSSRRSLGDTLSVGPETPLWNEVIAAAQPLLKRRGEKAKLGRLIGLPRQRINDFFVARNSLPDGERMLMILHWVHARRVGRDLG